MRTLILATALLTLAGCTDVNITEFERPDCAGEGETYRATYYPEWADSVVAWGDCGDVDG